MSILRPNLCLRGSFFGMEKFHLKCGECGEEIDAFISAEEMNEGPESCPGCGASDSFEHVEAE
jgi:DNA-directed RNA polymerase subunit RPC12/RpoP